MRVAEEWRPAKPVLADRPGTGCRPAANGTLSSPTLISAMRRPHHTKFKLTHHIVVRPLISELRRAKALEALQLIPDPASHLFAGQPPLEVTSEDHVLRPDLWLLPSRSKTPYQPGYPVRGLERLVAVALQLKRRLD